MGRRDNINTKHESRNPPACRQAGGFRVSDFGFVMLALSPLLLTGCAKISHLDQLLTLKDLSEEQERLHQHVKKQDDRFNALREAVEDKTIDRYDERKILKNFGEPVYREEMVEGNQKFNRWTYRYTTRFFDSPKVYLYLDSSGHLLRWELIGGEHGTSR